MRNISNADADSTDRLSRRTPAAERTVLAPDVVAVNLSSDPRRDGELPFAPGWESGAADIESGSSLVAALAASPWRRPVMILLAVAVAGSVVLAAQRGGPFDSDGQNFGAIAKIEDDEVASQALNGSASKTSGEIEARASGSNVGSGAGTDPADEVGDSSGRGTAPLQVTATTASSSTSRSDSSTAAGGGSLGRTSLTSISTTTSGAAGETTERTPSTTSSSTARQATTPLTTAVTKATSESTETTRRTTTTKRTTTTAQTTTTRRTTTTMVLIGTSAGGFESPPIEEDMVWLENGDVGDWRSTNDDIQLMQSGFEDIGSVDGGQFAELNSSSQAGLYRTFSVEPGTILEWQFLHRARNNREQLEVRIGTPSDLKVVDTVEAASQWQLQKGRWQVPDGMTQVRFMLWSKETGAYGNLVDAVWLNAVSP